MKPLKVAIINNFPPYSGTGRVAYELFKNLRSEQSGKVEADLFCTHFMRRDEVSWKVNKDVKFLHNFAYKEHENLSRALIYFVDPYRIPKSYDIYHVTNHMLGWFAIVRRPSVVTVHDVLQFKYRENFGTAFSSLIYNYLMDKSIKNLTRANHIISVSKWSADQVSTILNIPREKISVVYNGIDHGFFKPYEKWESRKKLNLPLDAKIILNVGSEIKRKNLQTLLKSLRLIVDKNPKVILLRVGEKTPAVSEIIENLRLSENVSYLNFVPEGNLPFVYSSADVLVIPSLEEGFGFPVIEAQSCGIPVIASRKSSLPEIGGSNCFYIEREEDEVLLAEMISDVISAPSDRLRNIVESGIENAGKFSWEKNARETISVYEEVLSKDGKVGKVE